MSVSASSPVDAIPSNPQSLLVCNAQIYCGWGPDGPCFSPWMTVSADGYILAMGQGTEPPPDDTTRGTRIVNAKGRLVLPGLHDSHIHVCELGKLSTAVDLSGCTSIVELQAALRAHCTDGKKSLVVGFHWDQVRRDGAPQDDLSEIPPFCVPVASWSVWRMLSPYPPALVCFMCCDL